MRRFLAFLALVASLATLMLGAAAACGPEEDVFWSCLNPVTGKLDNAPYDENHYVKGVFDPCYCYGPCGPAKSCPIVVDAGPPDPSCSAVDAGDGGT